MLHVVPRWSVFARIVGIAVLSMMLSSCGIERGDLGFFCSTPCPSPDESRDSFCGCNKNAPSIPTHPGNTSGSLNFMADCICNNQDGTYSAWFFDGLTAKDWTIGKTVRVFSSSCALLNVCPMQQTADGGEQYFIVTGTSSLRVTGAGWNALFGGNYIQGAVADGHAMSHPLRDFSDQIDENSGSALGGSADLGHIPVSPDTASASIIPVIARTVVEEMSPTHPAPISEAQFDPASQQRGTDIAKYCPWPRSVPDDPSDSDERVSLPMHQAPILRHVQFIKAATNCRAVCRDFASGDCLLPPLEHSASELLAQLGKLRELALTNKSGSLKQVAIMKIFGLTDDPCHRGDTQIVGGKIKNVGQSSCALKAALPLPNTTKNGITLLIPALAVGDISFEASMVSIDFSDVNAAPFLRLEDDDLQRDWGGVVHSITASPGAVLVGTDNGCIMLGTDTP